MVWQSLGLALFPFLTVRENVEFSLRMRGVGKAERRQRADKWLERMHITNSPGVTWPTSRAASASVSRLRARS